MVQLGGWHQAEHIDMPRNKKSAIPVVPYINAYEYQSLIRPNVQIILRIVKMPISKCNESGHIKLTGFVLLFLHGRVCSSIKNRYRERRRVIVKGRCTA